MSENEKLIKSLSDITEFGVKPTTTPGFKKDFKDLEYYYKNTYTLNQTLFNTLVTFKHLAIIANTLKLVFDLKFETLEHNKYVLECKDLIDNIYQNYMSAFEDYVRQITSRIVDDIGDEISEQISLGKKLCKFIKEV